jgi:hypothetical protein
LITLFCGSVSLAQVNEQNQDTTKTGYSLGKVQIKDPQSVLSAYTLRPSYGQIFIPIPVDGFPLIILLY